MAKLIVANTTNVKEMKNGRPMNVEVPAAAEDALANCMIVELGAVKTDKPENDHVYTAQPLTSKETIDAAIEAGTAYVIVAPEIMVEEARRTDGHIGKFRFKAGAVQTAYQLQKHDRLEVSSDHVLAKAGYTPVSTRKMAEVMFLLASDEKQEAITMVKIEF